MTPLEIALTAPKAELHLHIEGTLEPELAFELAKRNRIALPYTSVEALKAAYNFSDLQSFLDLYYACADVLRTREDFRDLMLAYLRRAREDNVVHAEIFFDPQTHLARGIPFSTVIEGLEAGAAHAKAEWGVSTKLILCFLRHLTEDECISCFEDALPFIDRIDGFGLDSSERGNPPAKFARLFERCRTTGKPVVAHAGEEGPSAYITEALDILKVARIDHGVRAVEDTDLMQRLAREGIPLTVCPLSNVRLRVFETMREHTLPTLLASGIKAMINSDDPAYFGGYISDNIRALDEAFKFDASTWKTLFRNSFEASFVSDSQKMAWIDKLDEHFLRN